jgi:hypothetical protein
MVIFMTLAFVRRWFSRLPPYEQDLPLLMLDGVAYTPRMALSEVERGTPLGARLQALIESGRFGTAFQDEVSLAKIRLKELLGRYPPDRPIVATIGSPELPGRAYTPMELMEEIQRETARGKQWVQAEVEHMRRLMALR